MLKDKPNECAGCPLYGSGKGFVPDHMVGSDTTICLSTPSPEEVKRGASGFGGVWGLIRERYLPKLRATEVNMTHAVRCLPGRRVHGEWKPHPYPEGVDGLLAKAADHCKVHDPEDEGVLRIVMGPAAFEKFAKEHDQVQGQHSWRGHLLPEESE